MPEELDPKATENPVPAEPVEGQESKQENQEIDPELAGKSVAELAAMVKEQKAFIGRQATEVGKVRELADQVNYLRGALESRQDKQIPKEEPDDEFDFTKPQEYVSKAVKKEIDGLRRELAQRDAQRYISSARLNMEEGKNAAIAQNRELFAGIESEVEAQIAQQVRTGQISPELLGKPLTWKAAATLVRLVRGEDDKIGPTKRGMAAPQSDFRQTARRATDDDDIQLADEDREWMRTYGYDEKTLLDGLRRGRQMAAKGQLR